MCDLRSVLATGFFVDLQMTERSGPWDAHLHKMSTSEREAHMQVPCHCSSCLFLVFCCEWQFTLRAFLLAHFSKETEGP